MDKDDPLTAFTYTIEADLSSVKLSMPETSLSPSDLDHLLLAIGRIRATLKPEHPHAPPELNKWVYHPLDAWHLYPRNGATKTPAEDGFLLVAKSPAFGWCQYAVDPGEAEAMLHFLRGDDYQRPPDSKLN